MTTNMEGKKAKYSYDENTVQGTAKHKSFSEMYTLGDINDITRHSTTFQKKNSINSVIVHYLTIYSVDHEK